MIVPGANCPSKPLECGVYGTSESTRAVTSGSGVVMLGCDDCKRRSFVQQRRAEWRLTAEGHAECPKRGCDDRDESNRSQRRRPPRAEQIGRIEDREEDDQCDAQGQRAVTQGDERERRGHP